MAASTSHVKCETGTQLFSRLAKHPSVENLDLNLFSELPPGEVIEIFGEAGAGKTEFLYHFIARCILPESWNSITLDGLGAGVLFIDTDHHFNLLRLITILEKRLIAKAKSSGEIDSNVLENKILFIKECLQLLNVARCSNSEHLIITLHSLENFLASNGSISVLIIDSISAFYWLDRMNRTDQMRKLEDYYGQIVTILSKLISTYKLILIATKQFLMKTSDIGWLVSKTAGSNESVSHSFNNEFDFMGRHWQKFITCRLLLQKHQKSANETFGTVYVCRKGDWESKKYDISDYGVQVY